MKITHPRLLPALLMLLLLSLISASAQAAPIKLSDDAGNTMQLSEPPRRIISLLPSLTETVCALGACDRLVGVDRYSNHPASVNALPKLGGLDDTQIETIVALKPDVVILSASSRVQDRLASLGIKLLVLETRSHEDVRRVLGKIGELLGVAEPQKVWQQIDAAVHQAAASVPASVKGQTIYYEIDSAPYAAGESSFIGETLTRLGVKNIVGKELGPFPKLNPEFIVRADPQIIMVSQRSGASLPGRPGWAGIRALRNKQLCIFPKEEAEVISRPGPRMGEAAGWMARCLRSLAPAAKP
ncbi:ABC transporter substrate-binding protein [Paucibacter sp. DJ2R-2]|uniref:ABC transporter substrate-binding protein n=1 Tax=Paucibacter sp. DJ2R-2 TaxID=2893558 RepID=UPI0021E4882C|nr:helical backbone metal receptor [Paucibacter sp. DJ2R-2]MCV2420153.1 helical backbone metal receptor [Paucibacter sp. DJ4R-1]MCV2436920.1 helical backbone metal receptor [Paucibacter sp. DJ2R-2]